MNYLKTWCLKSSTYLIHYTWKMFSIPEAILTCATKNQHFLSSFQLIIVFFASVHVITNLQKQTFSVSLLDKNSYLMRSRSSLACKFMIFIFVVRNECVHINRSWLFIMLWKMMAIIQLNMNRLNQSKVLNLQNNPTRVFSILNSPALDITMLYVTLKITSLMQEEIRFNRPTPCLYIFLHLWHID